MADIRIFKLMSGEELLGEIKETKAALGLWTELKILDLVLPSKLSFDSLLV